MERLQEQRQASFSTDDRLNTLELSRTQRPEYIQYLMWYVKFPDNKRKFIDSPFRFSDPTPINKDTPGKGQK